MVREEKPELEEAKAEEDEEGMGEELNFPERENDPSTGPLDLLEEAAIFFFGCSREKEGETFIFRYRVRLSSLANPA